MALLCIGDRSCSNSYSSLLSKQIVVPHINVQAKQVYDMSADSDLEPTWLTLSLMQEAAAYDDDDDNDDGQQHVVALHLRARPGIL